MLMRWTTPTMLRLILWMRTARLWLWRMEMYEDSSLAMAEAMQDSSLALAEEDMFFADSFYKGFEAINCNYIDIEFN